MAWKGIKHKNVDLGIETLAEWMDDELHEIEKGATLPETGEAGDFFILTTDGHLYIWKE